MKKLTGLFFFLLITMSVLGQVKIHSHNDYTRSTRFHLAYATKVDEIEADVFEQAGKLIVAHTKKEMDLSNTLAKLYLNPIDSLFNIYGNKVSSDKNYTFSLMIDFKTSWQETYPILKREIEKYGDNFDRSKKKNAVQIVISGNRPPDSTFHQYPGWIYFDGLPNTNYAVKDLKKVTMISDNFKTYSNWTGSGSIPEEDKIKLQAVIAAAHQLKKPIRFWGAPDTKDCWQELHNLGADIINTDKITECKTYFEQIK